MIARLLFVSVVGRLLIWTLQTSGPTQYIWALKPFLTELAECDFCMGFWVYLPLAAIFDLNVLDAFGYYVGLSEIATALAMSFVVHIARIGWMNKFGPIEDL